MKKLLLFSLILLSTKNWAQCASIMSPTSATVTCGGPAVTFTSTSASTLSLKYYWYSPLNPLPAGAPMYTTTGLTSVFTASLSPGVYTVVTNNLANTCTNSVTFTITSLSAYPSFGLNSSTNYTLGCVPLNQTTLSILNPVSTQTPPATCSFTFLPAGFGGTLAAGPYGGNTSTVTTLAGTWSVIVHDNSNLCNSILPVIISQNTVAPSVSVSTTNTMLCSGQTATLTVSGANTYTWNPGGAGASIAVSPTVTSNYTVTATAANACTASAVLTQSVQICIGIDQQNGVDPDFGIFPNPNNGEFNLKINGAQEKNMEIKIFNIFGQEVYKLVVVNSNGEINKKIDISEFSAGTYFVKIKAGDGIATKKIVIAK